MKIDRVILSTNDNEDYYSFWPLVAKRWSSWGIAPELFVVSKNDLGIDNSLGNVTYIDPLDNYSTAHQAQIARFFGATNFKDEVCLISDIDMMPLNKDYFIKSVDRYTDDSIVFYSADAYLPGNPAFPAYPMCYMAAKGKTFEEIIKSNLDEFSIDFPEWMSHGYGWFTDEKVFYQKLQYWKKDNEKRMALLRRGFNISNDPQTIRRIDRANNSHYNGDFLKNNFYVDYHMPRPYKSHKNIIDLVFDGTITEG